MSDWPTPKRAGDVTISVDQRGYPYWTRIEGVVGLNTAYISLNHDEARDLLYAMQRIVAFLDNRIAQRPGDAAS